MVMRRVLSTMEQFCQADFPLLLMQDQILTMLFLAKTYRQ